MRYRVVVELTAEQLEALRQAREHVRVRMAHEYPWAVRDAAMEALGMIAGAAQAIQPDPARSLVDEMYDLPAYRGWQFSCEYPGLFQYSHPGSYLTVFFTPDWGQCESLPIQVQDRDGGCHEEHGAELPLPREGRTGLKIFDLVRPTLDKLLELL